MALTMTEENVAIPCSICQKPFSNKYSMTFMGKEVSVYACSECATKKDVQTNQTSNKPTVHCPFCQSTDCKKISAASKIGKIAMWGVLAAGSVGKTWHCNSCGSNFG